MSSERLTLADIAAPVRNAIVGGPFGSNLVSNDYVAAGVPVIRGQNMGGKWVSGNFAFVSLEKAAQLSQNVARPGDVVFTQRGTLGQVSLVPNGRYDTYVVSQSQMKITVDPTKADAVFIYYLFKTPEQLQYIFNSAIQTGVPHTNLGILKATPINLPPLSIQRSIAAVVSSLDDRIALLRETNATLEAIAQALFKSWFVDFDPVRAKQQGIAPAGMDEATAALFPDSLAESVLGLVPQSWRLGALDDLADLNSRSWSGRNHPERVRYLDLANVKDNEIVAVTDFAFDDAPSRARRALRNGDTIVGTVRPGNRSFAFIHEPEPHLTASTGFAVLSPRAVDSVAFVYLAATQDASIEHLAHVADGGAYPAVRPDVVSALACVVPSSAVLHAFNAAACRLLEKVSANQCQAQTLAALRDSLLPRLISGQLRLPESQPMMESKP